MTRILIMTCLLVGAALAAACQMNQPIPDSSAVAKRLQYGTAGFTGCMPDDNRLSNISARPDGSALWNASCQDKVFLCSTLAGPAANVPASFSCAPVVH